MDAAHLPDALRRLERHRALVVVLAAFGLCSAFVIPTLAPVAVSDDWIYGRAVETLVHHGRLAIPDLSATSLVAQIGWGGLFAAVLGFSLGVVRVSTVVLFLLGGVGLYGICQELRVTRARSALVVAAYLFNPVALMLAHTFMTDSHFVSWLLLATWAYLRGLRHENLVLLVSGSALTSVAVLVRHQGIFIPAAIIAVLLVTDRRPWRGAVMRTVAIGGLPAVVMAGYYLAFSLAGGVPEAQSGYASELVVGGVRPLLELMWRLPYIELTVIGLALLPLAPALVRRPRWSDENRRWPRLAVMGTATIAVVVALVIFVREGRLIPYAHHFASSGGIGPGDLHGARPDVFPRWLQWALTLSAVGLGLAWLAVVLDRGARELTPRRGTHPSSWLVVAAVLVGQVAGTFPPSFTFLTFGDLITLDRYLLPVVPLGLALLLAALRRSRMRMALAWAGVAFMAAFSVVSARDYLVYESTVWSTAQSVLDEGVPPTKLDAGVSWDGWQTSDGTMYAHTPQTPQPAWWLDLYGPRIDSTYVIANSPIPAYSVIRSTEYSSWLHRDPMRVYVLQRLPEAGHCAPSTFVARRCKVVYP